tara:strand:- start:126 stop:545 length:420 start_codon:yes stop_codon:yes gene_type:complete
MAKYIIFTNSNGFFKIASTEAIKDQMLNQLIDGIAVEANDSDWSGVASMTKNVALQDGSLVYEDNLDHNLSKEMFNDQLQNQINLLKNYLKNNSSSEWTTYLNNLESVDIESLSYPIDNFQKWFNSQSGFSSKSILELP